MILEELDTSFSQLYKYPQYTASATQQGPVRYGSAPSGFKGDKDGIDPSKLDGRLFPQKNTLSKSQIKKIEKENKTKSLKKRLIKSMEKIKYGK
jgi:hypothetical protein